MNRYNKETTVFELAFRHTDFRKASYEQWKKYSSLIAGNVFSELVSGSAEAIKLSAVADRIRWNSSILISAEKQSEKFVSESEYLIELAAKREAYMDKGLSDDTAMLYYDLNGVYGWMFNEKIVSVGDAVEIKEIGEDEFLPISDEDKELFICWNTSPDGSDTEYMPGDEIILNSPNTTLYAQWKK